jgi:hypothetical protein
MWNGSARGWSAICEAERPLAVAQSMLILTSMQSEAFDGERHDPQP